MLRTRFQIPTLQQESTEDTLWFCAKGTPVVAPPYREIRMICTFQRVHDFVALDGTAVVLARDETLATKFWTDSLRPVFPQGPSDDTLRLIKFTPSAGESWDWSCKGTPIGCLPGVKTL